MSSSSSRTPKFRRASARGERPRRGATPSRSSSSYRSVGRDVGFDTRRIHADIEEGFGLGVGNQRGRAASCERCGGERERGAEGYLHVLRTLQNRTNADKRVKDSPNTSSAERELAADEELVPWPAVANFDGARGFVRLPV